MTIRQRKGSTHKGKITKQGWNKSGQGRTIKSGGTRTKGGSVDRETRRKIFKIKQETTNRTTGNSSQLHRFNNTKNYDRTMTLAIN